MEISRFCSRIKNMWEERNIVLYLKRYHSDDSLGHQEKIDAVKEGVERGKFFKYVNKVKYKNDALGDEINEESRDQWKEIRYLIDECLEDDYIKEVETYRTEPTLTTDLYQPRMEMKKVVDEQYILLTAKGKKLARWYYFYFKFLPEEFGDLKIVLLAALGTALTSPLWQPAVSFIGAHIKTLFTK